MVAKGDNGLLMMDLFKAIQDFPSKYQYRGMVQYIHQTSEVTVKEFNNMDVSKHFWIDVIVGMSEKSINSVFLNYLVQFLKKVL